MRDDQGYGQLRCPKCGALLEYGRRNCWLCGENDFPESAIAATQKPIAKQRSNYSFGLEGLLLVVTLVSICLGLITQFPGLGILVSVLLAPVFVRTVLVVRRRESLGVSVSLPTKIGLFLGSFGTAMVIVVIVSLASVGTFCAVCLGIALTTANGNIADGPIPIAISVITAIVATIFVVTLSNRWIRARWRRDTKK